MCFIENLARFSNNRPQTTNWKFNPYLTIIFNIFTDKIENKKYNATEGKIVYKQKFKKNSFKQYLTLVNGSTMRTAKIIKIGLTTSFELENWQKMQITIFKIMRKLQRIFYFVPTTLLSKNPFISIRKPLITSWGFHVYAYLHRLTLLQMPKFYHTLPFRCPSLYLKRSGS
jgi:hypothetical protein